MQYNSAAMFLLPIMLSMCLAYFRYNYLKQPSIDHLHKYKPLYNIVVLWLLVSYKVHL